MNIGVSYFGNRILKHVREDMRDFKNAGFTFVLHTFSEFDLTFNKKTMEEIVTATHDEGLKVIANPWGVGNVFGGEPFSNFVAQHFTDSCQILDDNNHVAIACPNSPKFISFMEEWISAVSQSGVDTILWDEPHFHEQGFLSSIEGRWGCRCSFCKDKFFDNFNFEMPEEETEDVLVFKKNSIVEFIQHLSSFSREKGLKNILYLTSNLDSDKLKKEWQKYFQINSVDIISTGPYWLWEKKPVSYVSKIAEELLKLGKDNNKEVQIWIQGFKILEGKEFEIKHAINSIVKIGINNFAVWGHDGVKHQSWLACDNPGLVWRNILEAVSEVGN